MTDRISPLTELRAPLSIAPDATETAVSDVGAAPRTSVSFGDVFGKMLGEANSADLEASRKVDALARGASDDLHGTMIAVKEADISVKLVGTIRNKLLDAFNELWRTSV